MSCEKRQNRGKVRPKCQPEGRQATLRFRPSEHRLTLATEQVMWLGHVVLRVIIPRGEDDSLFNRSHLLCRNVFKWNGGVRNRAGLRERWTRKGSYSETKVLEDVHSVRAGHLPGKAAYRNAPARAFPPFYSTGRLAGNEISKRRAESLENALRKLEIQFENRIVSTITSKEIKEWLLSCRWQL
jgi:hypothetical protein